MIVMNPQITTRQKELLGVIYQHIRDTGYPPSFQEMKEGLGVSSNQSVIDLLSKLERGWFIKRSESSARSIAILPLGYSVLEKPPLVAFLGAASAGSPTEVIEIPGEWEEVSTDVAKLKGDVFLLKIIGDSMINAGIEDNDVVLVQGHKEFSSGNIVLAEIAGETTVKRFISDDKPPYVYLKPENPNYSIVPFTEETRLVGKVISVLKSGYWKSVK